jgi:hypothetical protein
VTTVETVTVKGSPVKSLLKFLDSELTPEQREAVYLKLPPEQGQRFRRGNFLVTETLPVSILNQLTEEAAKAKGEPVDQFARRAGRFAAGEAMSGVYRLFALVLTPTALLSKASKIWGSLYNRGDLKVKGETSTGAKVMLVDFPSESAGCSRITGWIERMAELTGAKNARVTHTQCVTRNAPHCEWDVFWGELK